MSYQLFTMRTDETDAPSGVAACIVVRDAAYAAAAAARQLEYEAAVRTARIIYAGVLVDDAASKAAASKTASAAEAAFRDASDAAIGNKALSLAAATAVIVAANQAAAASAKAAAAKALDFELLKVHAALNAKYMADHAYAMADDAHIATIRKADQDFAECIKRKSQLIAAWNCGGRGLYPSADYLKSRSRRA